MKLKGDKSIAGWMVYGCTVLRNKIVFFGSKKEKTTLILEEEEEGSLNIEAKHSSINYLSF